MTSNTMSKAWANGSDKRWRKIRAQVLLRDNYQCRLNTERCTGVANQVHHTLGRAITGDDPKYCVAACKECNLFIGEVKGNPAPRVVTDWGI